MTGRVAAEKGDYVSRPATTAAVALMVALGLLPDSRFKRRLMSRWLGWDIHPTARLEPCILLRVQYVSLGANAQVLSGSAFRDLRELRLGDNAVIGHWNWIGGAGALRTPALDSVTAAPATITLGQHAAVTSRHYIDCSGGVSIGAFSVVAGVRSTVLTHQIDTAQSVATLRPVEVGEYCFVCSDVKLVPGSRIPDRSVIAMGAVVVGPLLEEGSLYAGVPARAVHSVDGREFFHRTLGTVEIP